MPDGVSPRDLLKTARDLVLVSERRPRQTNLRRAVSTVYYAMFHSLAGCCANLLIGGARSVRGREAWHQVYRALEHGFARAACQNVAKVSLFPREIQDFAGLFVTMQADRHQADYDPRRAFYKSDVIAQIAAAGVVIEGFERSPLEDRRAFAALVLIRNRGSQA